MNLANRRKMKDQSFFLLVFALHFYFSFSFSFNLILEWLRGLISPFFVFDVYFPLLLLKFFGIFEKEFLVSLW